MPVNQPVLLTLAVIVISAYVISLAYAYTFDPESPWKVLESGLLEDQTDPVPPETGDTDRIYPEE